MIKKAEKMQKILFVEFMHKSAEKHGMITDILTFYKQAQRVQTAIKQALTTKEERMKLLNQFFQVELKIMKSYYFQRQKKPANKKILDKLLKFKSPENQQLVIECFYQLMSAQNMILAICYNASLKMAKMDKKDPVYGLYTQHEHQAIFRCKQNQIMAKDFLFGNKKIEDPVGS